MSPMLNFTEDEVLTLMGLIENEQLYSADDPGALTDERIERLERMDDKLSEALRQ